MRRTAKIKQAEREGKAAWMLLILNHARANQYLRRRQYMLSEHEVAHIVGVSVKDMRFSSGAQG